MIQSRIKEIKRRVPPRVAAHPARRSQVHLECVWSRGTPFGAEHLYTAIAACNVTHHIHVNGANQLLQLTDQLGPQKCVIRHQRLRGRKCHVLVGSTLRCCVRQRVALSSNPNVLGGRRASQPILIRPKAVSCLHRLHCRPRSQLSAEVWRSSDSAQRFAALQHPAVHDHLLEAVVWAIGRVPLLFQAWRSREAPTPLHAINIQRHDPPSHKR
mmetsp:Transcript_59099/g.129459  ORF Transcript_59099/g.129459 Transcript_59099/m.129459 type:complete len:213 (-) Transcript_59099:13-651(-)